MFEPGERSNSFAMVAAKSLIVKLSGMVLRLSEEAFENLENESGA